MKKTSTLKLGVLAIASFSASVVMSQDIHFTQFYNSPLNLNPSLAGIGPDIRVLVNYKDQWKALGANYNTTAFSFETAVKKNKWKKGYLGIGVSLYSDKAGPANLSTKQANFSFSSLIKLDKKNSLSAGLQGGYAMKGIDQGKLTWDNQYDQTAGVYDASRPTGEANTPANFNYGDFAAGVSWFYGKQQMYMSANNGVKANFGVSASHVNSPKQSFYGNASEKLAMKLAVHGMAEIGLKNTRTLICPSFMYLNQSPNQELTLGCMGKFIIKEDSKYTRLVKGSAFSIGGFYRNKDAVMAYTLFEYTNYAIGLSYDINVSSLSSVTTGRGGFELTLRYITPNPFATGGSRSQF